MVFAQVCNIQGCGMIFVQNVLLLTQQVVFGEIINQSCAGPALPLGELGGCLGR